MNKQPWEDEMRKKGTVAAQKDEALTKRYGQIGISAMAAAVRYQRPDRSEKSLAARSKSKGAARSSFRGTSPRR
jgi:hypothetical protein